MSQPVQHHYLPKEAYLKFFESPEKEGSVFMYQRNEETILTNTKNVAKERHLYSFLDVDGRYNTELESAFAEMEQVACEILKRINATDAPIILTAQEKSDLSYFLAMQVARTPAFRESLKKQSSEFAKIHMKTLASNKESLSNALDEIKIKRPDTPDISAEKMQKFILGEEYSFEMNGDAYFLKQSIQLGDHIYPAIMMKDMFVMKSKSVEFITSDYPVILIPDPNIPPFYSGGFLMSGIFIPVGKDTALFCKNPDSPNKPPGEGEKIVVGYKDVSPSYARWLNKLTIGNAERFIFGPINNPKIKKLFDDTSIPRRFYTSSPFSDKE